MIVNKLWNEQKYVKYVPKNKTLKGLKILK